MKTRSRRGVGRASIVAILVVVAVVVLLGIYAALVPSGQKGSSPSSIQTRSTSSTTTTSSTTSITPVTVVMPAGVGSNTALNYNPANITVVVGVNNTIKWVDQDSTGVHTVTARSVPPGAQMFDSGSSKPTTQGTTYTVTLTVPGTYTYYCIFHAWMTGTITVKQG